MKTINKTFGESMREASEAIVSIVRHCMRRLERMSWPSLLVMCIMLAFVVTILPLAVTLFVLFLLVKLVIGAFGLTHLQRRGAQPHAHDREPGQ